MDTFKILRSHALFRDFSDDELKALDADVELRSFAPGAPIIRYGEPGKFLGILASGSADVTRTTEAGGRKLLASFSDGDYFGEMSLLTGDPTSADVTATRQSLVLMIPADAFALRLASNPEAVKEIAKTITKRLQGRTLSADEAGAAWRSIDDPYGLRSGESDKAAKLLVLNVGEKVIKYDYYDTSDAKNNVEGRIDGIGDPKMTHSITTLRGTFVLETSGGVQQAVEEILRTLTDGEHARLKSLSELTAIGHRVVHGGEKFGSAAIIDDDCVEQIEKLSKFAPVHNPINLIAIRKCRSMAPEVTQVAVFDTAFHLSMPQHAFIYGIPYEFYTEDRIRRYGSHGISHRYVALRAATYLKRPIGTLRMITCHLGQGSSACAIDHGRSVDCSIGLSPLEGLMMKTRSGDIDPLIILYLMREKGLTLQQIEELLSHESGVRGVSGLSGDMNEVLKAAEAGDERAMLALEVFCYRARKQIGAYAAALGGVDALVFTGGIGRGDPGIRARICQGLEYMGIVIDRERNQQAITPATAVAEVSDERSSAVVLVIPDDEQWMIAVDTLKVLGYADIASAVQLKKHPIPIGVSAHHVHLCKEHLEALYGEGHELGFYAPLTQPGQYAAKETANLIGPKGRVDGVRVLGPLRNETQVEVSRTEKFKLGIDPPVRMSGDLDGTPGITLEGPKGTVALERGVICARRHVHMSPEDALSFGTRDKDIIAVDVEGDRPLVFGDVVVRVNPDYRLDLHVDTDEANAADVASGMVGYLESIQSRAA
jgi:acetate kinase